MILRAIDRQKFVPVVLNDSGDVFIQLLPPVFRDKSIPELYSKNRNGQPTLFIVVRSWIVGLNTLPGSVDG